MVGYPDQSAFSTSGEAAPDEVASGQGDWHHELIFLTRGRDVLARYGGEDAVDVGPAIIGSSLQVPEPDFAYSTRTNDRAELWSIGSAYHVDWRESRRARDGHPGGKLPQGRHLPGHAEAELTDHPLRAYGNSAFALTRRLTLYAGYTQGLEDSGVAPSSAENRGAVLPASLTWQVDSGMRYAPDTPVESHCRRVSSFRSLISILDASSVDRELGVQQARGIELSISGQQIDTLRHQCRRSSRPRSASSGRTWPPKGWVPSPSGSRGCSTWPT